jgi:hypothetical protein
MPAAATAIVSPAFLITTFSSYDFDSEQQWRFTGH